MEINPSKLSKKEISILLETNKNEIEKRKCKKTFLQKIYTFFTGNPSDYEIKQREIEEFQKQCNYLEKFTLRKAKKKRRGRHITSSISSKSKLRKFCRRHFTKLSK